MTIRGAVYLVIGLVAALMAQAEAAEKPPIMGLSYTPSGIQSEAQLAKGVPESVIRADLERLKPLTSRVRTYTVDRGLDRVPDVARALGMTVSLGLWIGKDAAKNEEELKRGIKVIERYADVIDRIFVGNETIEHGGLTAAEIMGYIRRVKEAVPGMNVGTAENWHVWLAHKELAGAVDFVGVHLLPYWDGLPVERAVEFEAERFGEVKRAFSGKPIVVAETGWPSAGEQRQAAIPSAEGQAMYVRAFLARAARESYDFYIIEAFDQPSKAASFESSVGPHWGVFDAARRPKFSVGGR